MFRREVDGEIFRFSLYGLWGSGNVVTERDLMSAGTNNAYTMWDGHALFGPPERASLTVEKFPALLANLPRTEFIDRYRWLDEDCLVWAGQEELGLDCDETCAHLSDLCSAFDVGVCLADCEGWPRSISECLFATDTCPDERTCNLAAWEDLQSR